MKNATYHLAAASAKLATATFALGVVLSAGSIATLFAVAPFVDDRTEQAIADVLLFSARAVAIAAIWSGSSGVLAMSLAPKEPPASDCPQEKAKAEFPDLAGENPCVLCKFYTIELRPCAVHPLGKPSEECPDWEQRYP